LWRPNRSARRLGAEGDRLHAQRADIEVDGLVDVGDGEDQVVDPIDHHR
jgi:hypothetical protein